MRTLNSRFSSPQMRGAVCSALVVALALPACDKGGNTNNPDGGGQADGGGKNDGNDEAERKKKAEEMAQKQAMLQALPDLPGIEAPRPVVFPEPTVFTLPNGLEVIVLQDKEIPAVDISLQIRAGDIYSPANMPTLAGLVASALSEGTTKREKAKVDEAVDATGGTMSAGAGSELTALNASFLSKDLDTMMGILAEEAMFPAFPEDAITKLNGQVKQGVRAEKGQPQALANRLGARLLFGENSAYGRGFPTDSQIDAVKRADVEAFHKAHYLPNNAMLVVAGDVDPKKVEALAKKHFGSWAKGADVAVPVNKAPQPAAAGVHIIDRKASAQANIYVFVPAPKIGDAGWLEIEVAENVLSGGTLTTRLNFVLREQLGLTYGAGARFNYGFEGGWFAAGGGTKNETANEFADALIPLVFDLGKEPVATKDLERTKSLVSGRFALEAEGLGTVARRAVVSRLYNLPTDFWTRYRSDVASIDSGRLFEVSKTVFDRSKMQIIAVGKAKVLEEQLSKYGPVFVYDADLKRIK